MERKSLILMILMIVECVAAGVFGAYCHERNIIEVYYKEITVIEDIVFDDETVRKNDGAVTIPAGKTGTIR